MRICVCGGGLAGGRLPNLPLRGEKSQKSQKISKNFYPLKRAIRPDGAQLVEKNIFEIFGSSSCMLIYGISAYFGSIWQVGPF